MKSFRPEHVNNTNFLLTSDLLEELVWSAGRGCGFDLVVGFEVLRLW